MLWARSQDCPVASESSGMGLQLMAQTGPLDMQTGCSDSCLGLAGPQNPVRKQENVPAHHSESQHIHSAAPASDGTQEKQS